MKSMLRGILLAGGYDTRLYPMTKAVSKHLLPVYNKPMVYYPIALMTIGVQEIVLITHPLELSSYQRLLGDGSQWGIHIMYKTQRKPVSIIENFILVEDFIENCLVCLMLGDNIFYGDRLSQLFLQAQKNLPKSTIFTYLVDEIKHYGIVEFNLTGQPVKLIKKPRSSVSKHAITGLYFYSSDVLDIVKSVKKEDRRSFTVTDLNRFYLENKKLNIVSLPTNSRWFDAGTHESLIEAANFVQVCERERNSMIGCPELIAWQRRYINDNQLKELIKIQKFSHYGACLKRLISSPSQSRIIL